MAQIKFILVLLNLLLFFSYFPIWFFFLVFCFFFLYFLYLQFYCFPLAILPVWLQLFPLPGIATFSGKEYLGNQHSSLARLMVLHKCPWA